MKRRQITFLLTDPEGRPGNLGKTCFWDSPVVIEPVTQPDSFQHHVQLSVTAEVDFYMAPFRLAEARLGPVLFAQVWILPEGSYMTSSYLTWLPKMIITWLL